MGRAHERDLRVQRRAGVRRVRLRSAAVRALVRGRARLRRFAVPRMSRGGHTGGERSSKVSVVVKVFNLAAAAVLTF